MSVAPGRHAKLGARVKLRLAATAWKEYVRILAALRQSRLPDLVRRLESAPHHQALPVLEPRRLGRLVHRVLRVGPFRPRCLTTSLVLFRMLVRQGEAPRLVVGLPPEPTSHEAHAWVEVEGVEIGPPPGRLGHEEMARYGERPLVSRGEVPPAAADPGPPDPPRTWPDPA